MIIDKKESFFERVEYAQIFVLDKLISKTDYVAIDLSITNEELSNYEVSSSASLQQYINDYLLRNNAKVAFGGYLETRGIYNRSEHFNRENPDNERNIHLGTDLWAPEGTSVLAAFDGEIHSFKNNTEFGDYGPTIILKHHLDQNIFYTLYGHLNMASIANIRAGNVVKQGEIIAQLGSAEVNGDYPPHLHFQVIDNIESCFGDYPGVCSRNKFAFYKENCPNSTRILGL